VLGGYAYTLDRQLADALLECGRAEEALEALEPAGVPKNVKDPPPFRIRARILLTLDRRAEAAQVLRDWAKAGAASLDEPTWLPDVAKELEAGHPDALERASRELDVKR
jgi:hypothetical protein